MTSFLLVSSVFLWVLVIFNILLTLALIRRISQNQRTLTEPKQGLEIGETAPDFRANTLDGKLVTRADYIGRQVALVFIDPHCAPCRDSLPEYKSIAPKARQAGIEFVLVSIAEVSETQDLVDQFGLDMPILVAPMPDNAFMIDYKLQGTPSYCLINPDGKVLSAGIPDSKLGMQWATLVKAWELMGEESQKQPKGSHSVSKGQPQGATVK